MYLLVILVFVVVLAAGEYSGTFSVADNPDGLTGYTRGGPSITANQYVTGASNSPFSLQYTTPTKLNIGERIYYKVQAYDISSKSAAEKAVYSDLSGGKTCNIQAKMYKSSDNSFIAQGSVHSTFTKKYSGAVGNYYELNDDTWSTLLNPGKAYIKTYYTCTSGSGVWDTSVTFEWIDPNANSGAIDQARAACNIRDIKLCVNGQLDIKDYTYIDSTGSCTFTETTQSNDNCFIDYMVERCAASGATYNPSTKSCKTATGGEVVVPVPDQPPVTCQALFVCEDGKSVTGCSKDVACAGHNLLPPVNNDIIGYAVIALLFLITFAFIIYSYRS